MSRSKLSNNELKFYQSNGGSDTIFAKIKGTSADTLILEGSTGATKVTLSNVADPTGTGHAATKDYVDTKVSELNNGLSWKAPVKLKTTANVAGTLTGNVFTCTAQAQQAFDGIAVVLNDRVLIANQTTQLQNGIYTCTAQGDNRGGSEQQAVFTRAVDADTAAELKACAVFVEQGGTHADTAYVQTADNVTLNTDSIVWAQFSSAGEILAGTGLSKSGNTISADVDNVTIEISAGELAVKSNSLNSSHISANSLTGGDITDASITAAEMADNACPTRVIEDSAVTTAKIAGLAVTQTKIADGACVADKISSDAVTTAKILNANVTNAKIANAAVDSDKLADSACTSTKIASGAVLTANLGDAQVSTAKVIDGNITSLKLASNAVTSSKISASNVLTSHIAANQITTALIASDQIQAAHLKSNSITTNKVLDSAITADKLANNSVTTSKIGTLNGLTVNGIVSATSFLASGSGGESDGGFALPKSKSLSIDFNTDQSITGNNTFATLGGSSNLAAVTFAYDDNITMTLMLSVFRVKHTGTNGSVLSSLYEISYYNGAEVAQAYSDVTSQVNDFSFYSSTEHDYLLGHQAGLGDGSTRIAGIRLRLKHTVDSDTVKITDSVQITAIAIDDSSGNINRTYNNGSIS